MTKPITTICNFYSILGLKHDADDKNTNLDNIMRSYTYMCYNEMFHKIYTSLFISNKKWFI